MKKQETFRPVEFWKSAVKTMPDNSFYELLRSVFGKIKTPFNKQQLLNDLETFLLREDIQKTIAAYIDETDSKIIAAAALFGEPVIEQLESFFSGSQTESTSEIPQEISQAQLQDIIVNLEERFILYRFFDEKTNRIALNPVLKPILLPVIEDVTSLFPPADKIKKPYESETLKFNNTSSNDLIFAGLYSFVSRWESFYKSDGTNKVLIIRKRVMEEIKNCFPGIDMEKTLGALQILGLFYTNTDKLVYDKKYFNDFSLLSPRERNEYYSAALLIHNEIKNPAEILPPLYRVKIQETVNFIHSFINSLNCNSEYSELSLKRMAEVLKAQLNINISIDVLLETLEKTKLLVKTTSKPNYEVKSGSPVIVIESNSSILVYPEIDFTDAVKLASFLDIRKTNPNECTIIGFELNKDSAIRAFDNNLTADEIIELLSQLSGNKVNDTLIWNLKDWEKRYKEISLKKGVILQLSPEHHYLTETKLISRFIIETLAPGIYLLNENVMEEVKSALQKAGIDIIANRKEKKEIFKFTLNNFPSLQKQKNIQHIPASLNEENTDKLPPNHIQKTAVTEKNLWEIKNKYQTILKTMTLGETEQAELSARIERRLVLCESQLKDADIRYEKLEARLMDYAGKQNIAKQAITQRSPVEIICKIKGKEKRIFGIPKTLEKNGNELILVINAEHIPLAKISLLRRIKKSIFET